MLRYIVRVALGLLMAVALPACGDGPSEPLPSPFTAVQAGVLHSCGLVGDGAAYCWGFNEYGQIGDGSRRGRATPVAVLGELRFKALGLGGGHTCGVTTSDDVWCWGFNLNGQLGNGATSDRATPGQVGASLKLVSITAGGSYSCGLTGAGAAHCWGWNQFGQLGDGGTSDQVSPVAVAGGLAFTQVAAYTSHTCALTPAGEAYCWGHNDFGQLGVGTTVDGATPAPVSNGLTFSTIDVGFWHTCGLLLDGSAYCWGQNNFGQLGTGEEGLIQEPAPVPVLGGHFFSTLSVGATFSCAVEQGTNAAFCWGNNGSGQLGANVAGRCEDAGGNIFQCAFEPSPVSGGLAFQSMSAANQHVCGLTTDGDAYCWGLGSEGQLGDGSKGQNAFAIAPVRVAGQP